MEINLGESNTNMKHLEMKYQDVKNLKIEKYQDVKNLLDKLINNYYYGINIYYDKNLWVEQKKYNKPSIKGTINLEINLDIEGIPNPTELEKIMNLFNEVD